MTPPGSPLSTAPASALERHLPAINLVVYVLQVAVAFGVFFFAPDGAWAPTRGQDGSPAAGNVTDPEAALATPVPVATASTLAPVNPLAPPAYVFWIWVPIYAFTAVTAVTDCCFPFYSYYLTSDDPTFLRQWFQLSCITSMVWIVLDLWFGWVHLATLALALVWCCVLPLYLFVVRHPTPRYSQAWVYYFCSEFSVRLTFGWLSVDLVFALADAMQFLRHAYFPFAVYALLMGALLVLAFGAYVNGRDAVVGLVVSWAFVGLALKHATFPGDTQAVFENLQAVAAVVAPVFPILALVDFVRWAYVVYFKSPRRDTVSEEYYKGFVFETTPDYGTV